MIQPGGTTERPALFFDTADDFRDWLESNHASETGLWMGTYKRGHGSGLDYHEAVKVALCYGWIDSIIQRIDDTTIRQRWTPRKPKSTWSAVNVRLFAELQAAGLVRPAGLAAYERRNDDPEAAAALRQAESAEWPDDWAARLRAEERAAYVFYECAPRSYRTMCIQWVLSAKRAETREQRWAAFVEACTEARLIPPLAREPRPTWLKRLQPD